MFSDPWLDRWLALIAERSASSPVLEIGCGYGDDTSTLAEAGFDVVSFDLSAACVAATKLRVPRARVMRRDARAPLPVGDGAVGAVIASLSLHYFPWQETLAIVDGIQKALGENGVLLCRLNSTEDRNFGAGHGVELETNYFEFEGQTKRFFDRETAADLFGPAWRVISLEHMTTGKYFRQKSLWEVIAQKAA
ncbi:MULTISPECIES: class I SAM-dependent methyltransferase [Variovorax]|uniref:class I SAM-dependent methyltransferase n=1 Tax=Variovorax TaxID=34072 RepID=UPI00285C5CC0|nr:class I SAM-dependent methyltransferase [Variovorax sp. 3319]MDR6890667.1 SAM-dependent methyltransferase [Variovorax sp. 3319]